MAKIKVQNPIVEIDGDEMTRIIWHLIRDKLIHPYLDVVFEAFGEDRLMFGSDWPVCLLAGTYAQVFGVIHDYIGAMPASAQDKILGANAARVFGLDSKVVKRIP